MSEGYLAEMIFAGMLLSLPLAWGLGWALFEFCDSDGRHRRRIRRDARLAAKRLGLKR